MTKYSKAIVSFVSAIGAASTALSNGKLGYAEIGMITIAFTNVLAVFGIRNTK